MTPSKAVESDTVDVLTKLAKQNINTMGLTARIPKAIGFTVKQINEIGLIFNPPSPNTTEILFNESTAYANGILYVGLFGDKGKALSHFFQEIKHTPKKVVFIDDKLHYCEDVKNALEETSIPIKCVHYQTKAEKEFESFSPAHVHKEAATFIGEDQYTKILKEALDSEIV